MAKNIYLVSKETVLKMSGDIKDFHHNRWMLSTPLSIDARDRTNKMMDKQNHDQLPKPTRINNALSTTATATTRKWVLPASIVIQDGGQEPHVVTTPIPRYSNLDASSEEDLTLPPTEQPSVSMNLCQPIQLPCYFLNLNATTLFAQWALTTLPWHNCTSCPSGAHQGYCCLNATEFCTYNSDPLQTQAWIQHQLVAGEVSWSWSWATAQGTCSSISTSSSSQRHYAIGLVKIPDYQIYVVVLFVLVVCVALVTIAMGRLMWRWWATILSRKTVSNDDSIQDEALDEHRVILSVSQRLSTQWFQKRGSCNKATNQSLGLHDTSRTRPNSSSHSSNHSNSNSNSSSSDALPLLLNEDFDLELHDIYDQ
jgi:hypothetical protein